jgi:RNA polymerase sigma factor (sigma-70 family)
MPDERSPLARLFGSQTLRQKDDAQLIALCLADVAPAWDVLIDRYAALIHTVIRRAGVNPSDAHDLFQDVCVILYDNLEHLRNAERLSAWLVTTTKRAVWKWSRRHDTPTFSETTEEDWLIEAAIPIGKEGTLTPEQSVLNLARQWEIREGVAQLSPLCRQLLTMLYGTEDGATYAEVARALKMATNSVGPNRARCLEQLRKKLAESDSP